MAKVRRPAPAKASRAGRDMHGANAKVRREAAEVLAVIPRKVGKTRGAQPQTKR